MKAVGGRVSFTLGDAVKLGYRHIRRDMGRATINMASIALGISFLVTLLFAEALHRAHEQAGGAPVIVETYQYWLVSVALLVSVVGIANAMLIAVYERYKEIGTMKCLGALDRHILMLFLAESLIQGSIGGVAGLSIGFVASLISTGFTTGLGVLLRVPTIEFLRLVTSPILLSSIISVAATAYPAYMAAKLRPVEALRYEL